MKRKDLIATVEEHLQEIGFARGSWVWQPRSSELYVILGGVIKAIKLKTSMTKRALIFEMGRLAGLAEAAGIMKSVTRMHLNGSGHRRPLDGMSMAQGMPA